MLAEALKFLVDLTRSTTTVSFHPVPGDPAVVLVKTPVGVTERAIPPVARTPRMQSLRDFVFAVLDGAIAPAPEVYYGTEKVVAFCDRAVRRDQVSFAVTTSERWAGVSSLRGQGRSFGPKEAIQFLRFEVAAPGAEPVIQALRRVDFTRTSAGRTVNEHGRESLGRSVEAAVQQADQIPEAFTVEVAPFASAGLQGITVALRIGVVLDLEAQRVVFRLLPDEYELAMVRGLNGVGDLLREALPPNVPVFCGSPT